MACRLRCLALGRTPRGEATVIEPHGVRVAAIVDRQGRPAAVANRAVRLQGDRRRERPASIRGPRQLDARGCAARIPQHGDRRQRLPGDLVDGDAWRQLAAEPPLARCAVHLHGRAERAAAIPARGDEHVSLAVGAGAPRHGHERTVGRHGGRGVGAAGDVERHDASGG